MGGSSLETCFYRCADGLAAGLGGRSIPPTLPVTHPPSFQVNDMNFENMSNDDAVRVLRDIVHKPG